MRLQTQRRLLLSLGVLAGLLLVGGAALALPAKHKRHHIHCLPYFLIPQMKVCGKDVYLVANGRRSWIGRTTNFYPMPKPPPDRKESA